MIPIIFLNVVFLPEADRKRMKSRIRQVEVDELNSEMNDFQLEEEFP